MKVHGFDNTVPPPDDSRKNQKSIKQPPSINCDGKRPGGNGKPKGSIPPVSGSVARLVSGDDIIEINVDRVAAAADGDSARTVDNKGSVEYGRQSRDAVYSVQNISRAKSEINDPSRDTRLAKVRQNIADGYYDSPEFIEKLADTLINKLYLKGESG